MQHKNIINNLIKLTKTIKDLPKKENFLLKEAISFFNLKNNLFPTQKVI